jgi:sugar phosphate isomerase/epimerase
MPSLGAHTFGFQWQIDATAAVQSLAQAGFTKFELLASPPHLDMRSPATELARLRRAVEAVRGEILALDLPSNDVNLGSPCREVVDFALESYLATVDTASDLGARWVVVLPGRKHGLLPPPDDRLLDVFSRALEQIARHAKKKGVRLLLENHPQSLLPGATAMAAFLEASDYPGVDLLYDVANGFAIGEDPVAGLAAVRSRLGMVHLSDSPAGAWRHDPLGSGAVDFAGIRNALVISGYSGPVVVEIISPRPLEDLTQGRRFLDDAGWQFS